MKLNRRKSSGAIDGCTCTKSHLIIIKCLSERECLTIDTTNVCSPPETVTKMKAKRTLLDFEAIRDEAVKGRPVRKCCFFS